MQELTDAGVKQDIKLSVPLLQARDNVTSAGPVKLFLHEPPATKTKGGGKGKGQGSDSKDAALKQTLVRPTCCRFWGPPPPLLRPSKPRLTVVRALHFRRVAAV
jgi:hypothetical protein